jgi:hypothetical protein
LFASFMGAMPTSRGINSSVGIRMSHLLRRNMKNSLAPCGLARVSAVRNLPGGPHGESRKIPLLWIYMSKNDAIKRECFTTACIRKIISCF